MGLIFGLAKLALLVPLAIITYCLTSWFIARIAQKKDKTVSAITFWIPFLRYYKLIKVYDLPPALFAGLNASVIATMLWWLMGGDAGAAFMLASIGYIVTVASVGILWGRIAEAMGDKFNLWCLVGVITAFSYVLAFVTPLIFALSNCMPGGTGVISSGKSGGSGTPDTDTEKKKATQMVCTAGALKGNSLLLDKNIRIGRAPEMDFVVTEPEISRLHAELAFNGDKLLLTDYSRNGTFLLKNGKKARIVKDMYLDYGDAFEIGTAPTRFEVR